MLKLPVHKLPWLATGIALLLSGSLQAQNPAPVFTPQLPVVELPLNGRNTQVEMEDLRNPLMLIQTTRGDMVVELFPAEAPQTVANFMALAEGTRSFTDPVSGMEVQRPYYDGLVFHRIVRDFIIQGGSSTGQSAGTVGYSFNDEINAVSLGLDKMQLVDAAGYPNPVLGVNTQADFQEKILKPLYSTLGIASEAALQARLGEVEDKLRSMSVMDYYQLLGYQYSQRFQSRAPVRGMIVMANSGPNTNGGQFFLTLADAPWLAGRNTVFGKLRGGEQVLDTIGRTPVDNNARPLEPVTILLIRRINI